MEPRFTIHLNADVQVEKAMIVVGCPGEGLVGATAAKHIVSVLEMPAVGSIRAAHQAPPRSIVRGGRSGHPIRIHLASSVNARPFRSDRIVVIDVERLPGHEEMQPLADAIVAWAKQIDARLVVSPGGVTVDDEALDDKVWGVATSQRGLDTLDNLGVDRFEGSVGGLAAGLLNACEEQEIDGLCLLAEAAPEYPDSHAAARIVRLLDSLTPAFAIPESALVEQAEKIEAELRATLEMMAAKSAHAGQKR